jgi:hypothetical protein
MIVAVLFNSDDPKFGGDYGPPIRDLVFGTRVLQNAGRQLKILQGDVLIYSHAKTQANYYRLAEGAYFADTWSTVDAKKLRKTYLKNTICAWIIQNTTIDIAIALDNALRGESSYFGLHAVDYRIPFHLVFYRNVMPQYCRVFGETCTRFYSMGNRDEIDKFEVDELRDLGFANVTWEDSGAHNTIFDNYDTPEHFQQLRDVQDLLATVLPGGDDEAEELVMMLQDLNPKLFDVLGSAVRALSRAQTNEDFAHVGISGRRYVEQLADAVFPPRSEPYQGRDVSSTRVKNRLWAFINDAMSSDVEDRLSAVQALGKEVDRLIEATNSLLHGTPNREAATTTFRDLGKLSVAMLQLDPAKGRRPYLAFEKKIFEDLLAFFAEQGGGRSREGGLKPTL